MSWNGSNLLNYCYSNVTNSNETMNYDWTSYGCSIQKMNCYCANYSNGTSCYGNCLNDWKIPNCSTNYDLSLSDYCYCVN